MAYTVSVYSNVLITCLLHVDIKQDGVSSYHTRDALCNINNDNVL